MKKYLITIPMLIIACVVLLAACGLTGLLAPLIVYATARRITTSRALGLG